jgi:phosphonate transport system substrate-binding protein
VEAGKDLADLLAEETGYAFVVVVPETYARLVEALGQGNAHIAFLSPYAYAYAYAQGNAEAAFVSARSGEKLYGAQFIARTDSGFESYFDADTGQNLAEAAPALAQFNEKKPCWSDQVSPSGYVVPAGVLALNGVDTRPAAFLQGQPAVVRAVYAGGICDFGATYIDARTFPTVREAYPDVLEQVEIIWQVPSVIPYEVLALASSLPPEIKSGLQEALFSISGSQAGRALLYEAYGVGDWEPVSDLFYQPFRNYLEASGIDLVSLID